MAYQYRQELTSGGYVNYNITPGFDKPVGVGDTITINGQIQTAPITVKTIEFRYGTSPGSSAGSDQYVNKSISKGKSGTFSITITLTQSMVNRMCGSYANRDIYTSIGIFSDTLPNYGGAWDCSVNFDSSQKYSVFKTRVAPILNSVVFSDRDNPVVGSIETPLEYFGNYIAGQSLPTLAVTFVTDSQDTKLTTTHNLTITDENDVVVFDVTTTAASLSTEAAIDLSAITTAGTYTWTWTVTDSAGLTDDDTGTFTVLAYSPPSISAFTLARYRHDSVSGTNVAADNGTMLWLDLEASIASVESKNAWTMTMDYAEADGGTAYTAQIGSSSDGQTLSLTHDERLDDDYHLSFTATSVWDISVTITDMLGNSVTAQFTVPKAGAYFDIEKTGVAVGMRSTGEPTDRKFEVAEDYSSHFYGGIEELFIDWQPVQLNSGTTTPGVYGPCGLRIGKIGSHVFMRGSVRSKHGNTICIIPEEFRPKDIDNIGSGNCGYFWFAPTTGSNITRLNLNTTTGVLMVEWVKKISDASNVTSALTWVQVNIDWWLD